MLSFIKTRKKKWRSNIIAFLMIALLVFGISIPVVAASWRTGCFPSNGKNTSAITVSLTNKNKDAYIKIHTYTAKNRAEALKSNPATKERSCSVHVTMRDNNGKWIWEGDISSGSWGKKMKLGKDHKVYKLYLRHNKTVHCWDVGHYCPLYWGIECVSNCSVK